MMIFDSGLLFWATLYMMKKSFTSFRIVSESDSSSNQRVLLNIVLLLYYLVTDSKSLCMCY